MIKRFPHSLPLPLSRAVQAGGFLFLSGVVALDAGGKIAGGDIREQTRIVLSTVEATLLEHGLEPANVVRATVWLANLSDAAAFNEEYSKVFGAEPPARSAVQAQLYGDALVEIEIQAWAG